MQLQAVEVRKGDYIEGVGYVEGKMIFNDVEANKEKTKLPKAPKVKGKLELAGLEASEERECFNNVAGSVELKIIPTRIVRYRATEILQVRRAA
jgi:hypothetical protein